jgi:hypothetical protein
MCSAFAALYINATFLMAQLNKQLAWALNSQIWRPAERFVCIYTVVAIIHPLPAYMFDLVVDGHT